jgi:hypothetical protein
VRYFLNSVLLYSSLESSRKLLLSSLVLGTTLKGLHDDSRLPQRRRGIVTKKTDFVRFYRLYGNAATEVASYTRTPTRCDAGPSLQPGLLYTHPDLSIRPTTDDALLFGEWYWYAMADGNSRGTRWLRPTLYTSRGSEYTQWRNSPTEAGLRTLSTTNIRGDRGLVAWSEE